MSIHLQYGFMLATIFVGSAITVATQGLPVGLIILAVGAIIGTVGAKALTP